MWEGVPVLAGAGVVGSGGSMESIIADRRIDSNLNGWVHELFGIGGAPWDTGWLRQQNMSAIAVDEHLTWQSAPLTLAILSSSEL